MSRDQSPWHTLTVTTHHYVERATGQTELDYQLAHPAACDALPYGRQCWLDEQWTMWGAEVLEAPTEPGVYAAMYWRDGPDRHGEFEAVLEWELITPALPPPELTCYELHLGRHIIIPKPVNGVRQWPNARRVPLDRPLGPSPWLRTTERCPRCGKFRRSVDMRPAYAAMHHAADGYPREQLYVCFRCAIRLTEVTR